MKKIIQIMGILILISMLFGCAGIGKSSPSIGLLKVDVNSGNFVAFDSEIIIKNYNEAINNHNFIKELEEVFEDAPIDNDLGFLQIDGVTDNGEKLEDLKKILIYFPEEKAFYLFLKLRNSPANEPQYSCQAIPVEIEKIIKPSTGMLEIFRTERKGSFYLAIKL